MDKLIQTTMYGKGDSTNHVCTIFGIALSLKAKNILELGVRSGDTTEPLLKAAELAEGQLTSVDISRDDSIARRFGQHSQWNYVIKDAIEFLRELPKSVVYDLVYIDDWHDGLHVAKEIELIEPHITPSTVILVHDCMCFEEQPNYRLYSETETGEFGNGGPFAAIQSLDRNEWEYSTIPTNNGLTILRKLGQTICK